MTPKYDWRDVAYSVCIDWAPGVYESDFDTDSMVSEIAENFGTILIRK